MVLKGEMMKPLDVVKLVSLYIGQRDLLSTTTLGGNTAPTPDQAQTLDELLSCVNDVVETLAVMYFPLKQEETLVSNNGIVNFSSFSKTVCEIESVKDQNGFNVDYEVFPTYLKTLSGSLNYIYNYIPNKVSSYSANLDVQLDKVSLRLMALGVVSRFYLIKGMFNESKAWNDVFLRTVLALQTPKRNQVIKKRRWV